MFGTFLTLMLLCLPILFLLGLAANLIYSRTLPVLLRRMFKLCFLFLVICIIWNSWLHNQAWQRIPQGLQADSLDVHDASVNGLGFLPLGDSQLLAMFSLVPEQSQHIQHQGLPYLRTLTPQISWQELTQISSPPTHAHPHLSHYMQDFVEQYQAGADGIRPQLDSQITPFLDHILSQPGNYYVENRGELWLISPKEQKLILIMC